VLPTARPRSIELWLNFERAVMAPSGEVNCLRGLAVQDDAEFEPYRAGISAEAVDAAYRLLAPSAKVGPHDHTPAR
jgi:hypothetical protein